MSWPRPSSVCCRSSSGGCARRPSADASLHDAPPHRPDRPGGDRHAALHSRHLCSGLLRTAERREHHRQPARGLARRGSRQMDSSSRPSSASSTRATAAPRSSARPWSGLRDLAAAGGLDRVYVHSPDRLARRYAYQVLLVDELRRAGVEIVFLNRPIGPSAEDDLLLQVQGMVAEYERAKILERSRRGKRHAARAGDRSTCCRGAVWLPLRRQARGRRVARYEIVEEEARWCAGSSSGSAVTALSIGEVCRRLHRQGCATRSGKPAGTAARSGASSRTPPMPGAACFGKTRVGPRAGPARGRFAAAVSSRGVPTGCRRACRGVAPCASSGRGGCPRCSRPSRSSWRRTAAAAARARVAQRYLLQGLVVCRPCGYAYYGKAISLRAAKGKRRDYAYYRCCGSDAYRFGGQRVCANPQLRTDRLDEAVWHEVERCCATPGGSRRNTSGASPRHSAGTPAAPISPPSSSARQAAPRHGPTDRQLRGRPDRKRREFEPRIAGFRQRIQGWEARATPCAMRRPSGEPCRSSSAGSRISPIACSGRVAEADWPQRRELIRLLVKRIEIDREDMNIVFRVDPCIPRRDPGPGDNEFCKIVGGVADRPLRGARHCPFTQPSSTTPAFSHLRIRRIMRRSPIRCSTKRTIQSWSMLSKKRPDVGVQDPVHRLVPMPTASASSASCCPRPGRNP